MGVTTLVSVAEYLAITQKPNREYREGHITEKPMPTRLHALLQFALTAMLRAQNHPAYPELTVCLSPTRYLVPDVAVAPDFEGPYPVSPVTLCCEILSPDDKLGAMFSKCEEYHAWGVPYCWVLDPIKRSAWAYHANLEPEHSTGTLAAGDIYISTAELFSALD